MCIRDRNNKARGSIWVSSAATGGENGLKIRVYGTKGAVEWLQDDPNILKFTQLNNPTSIITRASNSTSDLSMKSSRVAAGHPEGYLEGFANIYREVADEFSAKISGKPISKDILYPTSKEGLYGVSFIEAAIESNSKDSVWTDLKL